MMTKKHLEDQKVTKRLAEKLSTITKITKYNTNEHKEEWIIAYGLSDMEDSFQKIPKMISEMVKDEAQEQEILDTLIEIAIDLKHIIYHCRTSKFFNLYTEEY